VKRLWYIGCRLENGEEVRTPFEPYCRYADAPDLSDAPVRVGEMAGPPARQLTTERMWQCFITTESAIDTRYPEEMQAKLPSELRGRTI